MGRRAARRQDPVNDDGPRRGRQEVPRSMEIVQTDNGEQERPLRRLRRIGDARRYLVNARWREWELIEAAYAAGVPPDAIAEAAELPRRMLREWVADLRRRDEVSDEIRRLEELFESSPGEGTR